MCMYCLLQDTLSNTFSSASHRTAHPKMNPSHENSRYVSGLTQNGLKAHVSFSWVVQQPVAICRDSGTSYFGTDMVADEDSPSSEEDNAEASADQTSDPPGPDIVQQPRLHIPPSQPNGQKTSSSKAEEDYRETPLKPDPNEDVVGEDRDDIDGKSKAPQHGSQQQPLVNTDDPKSVSSDHTSHEPTKENCKCTKQLLFSDIAKISDLPITYFTSGGPTAVPVAYTQCYVDIDPYIDRHE